MMGYRPPGSILKVAVILRLIVHAVFGAAV